MQLQSNKCVSIRADLSRYADFLVLISSMSGLAIYHSSPLEIRKQKSGVAKFIT